VEGIPRNVEAEILTRYRYFGKRYPRDSKETKEKMPPSTGRVKGQKIKKKDGKSKQSVRLEEGREILQS